MINKENTPKQISEYLTRALIIIHRRTDTKPYSNRGSARFPTEREWLIVLCRKHSRVKLIFPSPVTHLWRHLCNDNVIKSTSSFSFKIYCTTSSVHLSIVQLLYTYLLYNYCTPIVHLLYTYCTYIVHLLYIYCTPIVHILYIYCTSIVHLLFETVLPMSTSAVRISQDAAVCRGKTNRRTGTTNRCTAVTNRNNG